MPAPTDPPNKEQITNNNQQPEDKSKNASTETGNSPAGKMRLLSPPYNNIQVNRCKTPWCENFNVQPVDLSQYGKRRLLSKDLYRQIGGTNKGKKRKQLLCLVCNRSTVIKSNKAIYQEFQRQGQAIFAPFPLKCPDESCSNHNPKENLAESFRKYGSTKDGSPRFQCRECGKTTSIRGPTFQQRNTRVNTEIFLSLVNKVPFNRIMEISDVHPSVLYGKINFIHRQCVRFAADREKRLASMTFGPRSLCTDRQDYIVNWGSRESRKNMQLTAIATVDAESGYLFGLNLNFDPSLLPEDVERYYRENNEGRKLPYMRDTARVWTNSDYWESKYRAEHAIKETVEVFGPGVAEQFSSGAGTFAEVAPGTAVDGLEASELMVEGQALPTTGVQIHADYLVHGHFHLLKHLFQGAEKLNCFIDGDPGMVAGCIGAFAERIGERTVDIVQLTINKHMTIDERRRLMRQVAQRERELEKIYGLLSRDELRRVVLEARVARLRQGHATGSHALDRVWIDDPLPVISEPMKKLLFVTDMDQYDDYEVARLLSEATLWPLDTVFNMIRRRLSMFERPVMSVRRALRMWHIYAVYDPARAVQMLEIFRVWYNYLWAGNGRQTAAQKLGLAAGTIRTDHILGFDLRKRVPIRQSSG